MPDTIDRELLASLVEQINMQLGNIAEDINNLEKRINHIETNLGILQEENQALNVRLHNLEDS